MQMYIGVLDAQESGVRGPWVLDRGKVQQSSQMDRSASFL